VSIPGGPLHRLNSTIKVAYDDTQTDYGHTGLYVTKAGDNRHDFLISYFSIQAPKTLRFRIRIE
jgi:hypothetical protein